MTVLDRRDVLKAGLATGLHYLTSLSAPAQQPDATKKKVDALVTDLGSGIDTETFLPGLKNKPREVTNLEASGAGSFAEACRTASVVKFKVGGVIDLKGQEIIIKGDNISIFGSTAPEPITFVNGTVRFEGKNILVDNLRFICGNDAKPFAKGKEPASVKVSGVGTNNICFTNCDFAGGVNGNVHLDWSVEKGSKGAPSMIKFAKCTFTHALRNAGHNKTAGLFAKGHSCGVVVDDYFTGVEFEDCLFNCLQFGVVWGANSKGLIKNCVFQNIELVPIFTWPVAGEYKKIEQCKGAEVAVIGCAWANDLKKVPPGALVIGFIEPKPGLPKVPSTVHFFDNGVTSGVLPLWAGNVTAAKLSNTTMKVATATELVNRLHRECGAFASKRGPVFDDIYAAAEGIFKKPVPLKKGEIDYKALVDSKDGFGGYPKGLGAAERSFELPEGEAARTKEIAKLRASLIPAAPPPPKK